MIDTPNMLSRTAIHAIRAVLLLAQEDPDKWVSAAEVAETLGAPGNYMGKTLHALMKNRILRARRGPKGGYRLRIPPQDLTLAALVEAVDDLEPSFHCLLSNRPCSDRNACTVHNRWAEVTQEAWRPLQATTIADLIGTS